MHLTFMMIVTDYTFSNLLILLMLTNSQNSLSLLSINLK